MRIALIENSVYKIEQISELVSKLCPNASIEVARSFSSGRKLLVSNKFDLWILDMTIPTYERTDGALEGDVRIYGGRELLEEMEYYDVIGRAIIVTQFDKFGTGSDAIEFKPLLKQLTVRFPRTLAGGVFYSGVDSNWKVRFTELFTSCGKQKL